MRFNYTVQLSLAAIMTSAPMLQSVARDSGILDANSRVVAANTSRSEPLLTDRMVLVREYFNSRLGHYFLTTSSRESALLDSGQVAGWASTGQSFMAWDVDGPHPPGTTPVCRYYGRPEAGIDSHFYSAFPEECSAIATRFGAAWERESDQYFWVYLPDSAGACSGNTVPIYRVYNQRADVNHRYLADRALRDLMLGIGWISEGYGSDAVAMCVPPTPTSPSPSVQRVQIAEADDGPTWLLANNTLGVPWRNVGGDYADADGSPQGSHPFALIAGGNSSGQAFAKSQWLRVPVGAPLINRLLEDNTGIFLHVNRRVAGYPAKFASRTSPADATGHTLEPMLEVLTDQGLFPCPILVDTWLAADSAYPQSLSKWFSPPAILRFDLSSVRGTVQGATLSLFLQGYGGDELAIDYVDTPMLLTRPASQLPARVEQGIASTVSRDPELKWHPDVLAYLEPTDKATIEAFFQWGSGAIVSFPDWPEYGMKAVRVHNSSAGSTAINYRTQFLDVPGIRNRPAFAQSVGRAPEHLFVRYMLLLEPDVLGGSFQGTKLPGASGSQSDYVYGEWSASEKLLRDQEWGFSIEHGLPSNSNRNALGFSAYVYDMDKKMSNADRGALIPSGAALEVGHKYCIEFEMKMNTLAAPGFPNADGVFNLWLDGVRVYSSTTRRWRDMPQAQILNAIMLIMHGGNGLPLKEQHYQISGWTISKSYVGPPRHVQ